MIIKSDNITDLKIDSLKDLYKLRLLIEEGTVVL